jgi:hypothetical protein
MMIFFSDGREQNVNTVVWPTARKLPMTSDRKTLKNLQSLGRAENLK